MFVCIVFANLRGLKTHWIALNFLTPLTQVTTQVLASVAGSTDLFSECYINGLASLLQWGIISIKASNRLDQ